MITTTNKWVRLQFNVLGWTCTNVTISLLYDIRIRCRFQWRNLLPNFLEAPVIVSGFPFLSTPQFMLHSNKGILHLSCPFSFYSRLSRNAEPSGWSKIWSIWINAQHSRWRLTNILKGVIVNRTGVSERWSAGLICQKINSRWSWRKKPHSITFSLVPHLHGLWVPH